MVGKPILEFTLKKDESNVAEVIGDRLTGKRRFVQFETSIIQKSGKTVDIFVNASAAIFEGQPAVIGAVIDISARKQMEAALAASELKLQTALSNMSQGLMMFDAEGRLMLSNSRHAEMYGLPKDQILPGMTVPELMALAGFKLRRPGSGPRGHVRSG